MRSINSMIDGVREPYESVEFAVKLFGKQIFAGTLNACREFCSNRKVPLLIVPINGYAWRMDG